MALDIFNVLLNPIMLNEMQEKALITAEDNSIDNMLGGFKNAIEYLGYNIDTIIGEV